MAAPVRLPIGDFSRMTHLSIKALRHYHEVGVLEPAQVDQWSGYRFYEPAQVPVAHAIRRFRDLGMPLDEVKSVLRAPDITTRNAVIAAHLARMEAQLAQTQSVVASLRSLLERPAPAAEVAYQSVPAVPALAISATVAVDDVEVWWLESFTVLRDALAAAGLTSAGPDGALYSAELFEAEKGEVTAFVPVPGPVPPSALPSLARSAGAAGAGVGPGRVAAIEVPAAELAVALHRGAFADLDQTYGALGTYVAQRELGVPGPIREYYLVGPFDTGDESAHRTEVGWPILPASAR